MERARMKVTRVCVYHVDHDAATKSHGVTGEIFAHMLFECICHQVTIVGGDANRSILPEGSKTVEQLLQYVNMSVLDRKDGTDYGQILQGCFEEQQGL